MTEKRTSCLYDVMTLDLQTLKSLLATLAECVGDSDFKRPVLAGQVHAAQHIVEGIFKKLWALQQRYNFEVDQDLFEHQVHEFDWEIVIPKEATGEEKGNPH